MPAKKQGSAAKKQGSAASKKASAAARKTKLPDHEEAALQGHDEEEVGGDEEEVGGEAQERSGSRSSHFVGVVEQQEVNDSHEQGGDDEEEEDVVGNAADETMVMSIRKVSRSGAANMSKKNTGLVFNCYNMRRKLLSKGRVKKVKSEAAVYMAAVLEFIVAELMEISGNFSRVLKTKTIKPRHMRLAIDEDDEFKELFESAHVVLPGAGVCPRIHAVLSSVRTSDTFRGWNKQGQNSKVLASG